MANATRTQLEQAYNLIQQEKLDQAIAIIKPIVKAEPNNADAWWLMANAVSEPQDAYEALNNVLRLKPNHAEAKELLGTLKEEFPYLEAGVTSGFSDTDPNFDDLFGTTTAAGATTTTSDFGTDDLDDLFGDTAAPISPPISSRNDFDTDDIDALLGESPSDNRFSQPVSSSRDDQFDDPFGSDDLFADSEPGFVQNEALAQPAKAPKAGRVKQPKQPKAPKAQKAPVEDVPLDPLALEARANRRQSPFMLLAIVLFVVVIAGAIVAALFITGVLGGQNNASSALTTLLTSTNDEMTQSGFTSPQATVVDSSLGKTLMVNTCSKSGPDLPGRIDKAMDIAAKAAATVKDTVQGAGVQVVSCTNKDITLYRAIAPIAQVVTYVSGNMTDTRAFRSSWVKN